ncbi:MAG: GtrA family protein [Lysobacterales bacterium]
MKVVRELVLFGLAGVIGFVVDAGVLYLLKPMLGLYFGRLVSFICAVLTTWIINRQLTFNQRASGLTLKREFSRYLGLMLGGGVVNYMVYALLVYFVEFVARQPVWGVAAGSCAGMLVNYLLARFFIFRGSTA